MVMIFTGTEEFLAELREKRFKSASGNILLDLRTGVDLSVETLARSGFRQPILVARKDGLNIRVPGLDFTVRDVALLVNPNRVVDVIDVRRQEGVNMTLREFVEHFYAPNRDDIYNLISLEFSRTPLASNITAPAIVRRLSLVRRHWLRHTDPEEDDLARPHVQKYCLISMSNSFTDFHIDFGGSSVWYHILWGEKVFYFIEPTPANLEVYKRWMKSENNRSTFLPGLLPEGSCFELRIRTGNTLFIPSGWIHAVYTPVDSLVFGGNFLHELNIPMQLRIYAIEKSLATMDKFMFPYFEELHWFVAFNMIRRLKEEPMGVSPQYLVKGLAALSTHLKRWYELKVARAKKRFSRSPDEDDDDLPQWFDRAQVLTDLLKLVPTLTAKEERESSERSWHSGCAPVNKGKRHAPNASADEPPPRKKVAKKASLKTSSLGSKGAQLKREVKAEKNDEEELEQEEEDGGMTAHGCGGMRIRIVKKKKKKKSREDSEIDIPKRNLSAPGERLLSIKEELRLINKGSDKSEPQSESDPVDEETQALFGSAKESGDYLYYDVQLDEEDLPKKKKKSRPNKTRSPDHNDRPSANLVKKESRNSSIPGTSSDYSPGASSQVRLKGQSRKGEATVKQRLGKKLGLSKYFR